MYTCLLLSHSTHSRASSLLAIRLSQTNSRGIVMRSSHPFSYTWPAIIGQGIGYALDRSPILLLAWLLCIVHPGSRYSLDNKCSHTQPFMWWKKKCDSSNQATFSIVLWSSYDAHVPSVGTFSSGQGSAWKNGLIWRYAATYTTNWCKQTIHSIFRHLSIRNSMKQLSAIWTLVVHLLIAHHV